MDNAYTYDAYGRLQSLNDAPGVRSFTYNDDDLLVSQALTYTALPFNSTFNQGYGYNDDGSRSSLTLSNQSGTYNGSFTYSYDGRGELTGLVNPTGETYSWSYLGNGWLHTQQSGNAATQQIRPKHHYQAEMSRARMAGCRYFCDAAILLPGVRRMHCSDCPSGVYLGTDCCNSTTKRKVIMNVVVCVENKAIEESIVKAITSTDCLLHVVKSSYDLLRNPISEDVVILETNNDAVRLTQVVYEFHRKTKDNTIPCMIGLLSTSQVTLNPAVSLWNIDGHAALAALIISDRPDYLREVSAFVKRILTYT